MRQSIIVSSILLAACGSNAAPAEDAGPCQYNVYRHQPDSWLLTVPEVHLLFWGDYAVLAENFQANWETLIDNGVLLRLAEYGIHQGELDAAYYIGVGPTPIITDAGNLVLDDDDFVPEINSEIAAGTLPYPTDNTLYVLMIPSDETTKDMIAWSANGYHRNATYSQQRYAYAVILTNQGSDETNIIISHELYEAATNPGLGSGFEGLNGNQEIGDLCEGLTEYLVGTEVQKSWSQMLCQCL
jgi:hypothetical protein